MAIVIVLALIVGIASTNSYAALAALVVGAPLVYVVSCWLLPFAYCMWCKGSGKKSRADGKVFRNCRPCKGSGRRLRIGRKAYNRFHKIRKDAS